MTQESVASHARNTTPGSVLERIEHEIHRLREMRPALEDVIDRATSIIVTHLTCPRQRVIRVRVDLDGRPKFLVASLNERGATYAINPLIWACSCPAHHRRGGPCKHTLAAYVLWRAARPVCGVRKCDGCESRLPRRDLVEVQHENEHWFPGDRICRPCCDRTGVEW